MKKRENQLIRMYQDMDIINKDFPKYKEMLIIMWKSGKGIGLGEQERCWMKLKDENAIYGLSWPFSKNSRNQLEVEICKF